ncbi:hypothetical protein [Thermococcus sp.]
MSGILRDKRFYLVLFISLIFTGLAIADNTPSYIAAGTIALPIILGYLVVIKWGAFPGVILASVLWGVSVLVANLLAGSMSSQVAKTVILKMSNAIVGLLAFVAVKRLYERNRVNNA